MVRWTLYAAVALVTRQEESAREVASAQGVRCFMQDQTHADGPIVQVSKEVANCMKCTTRELTTLSKDADKASAHVMKTLTADQDDYGNCKCTSAGAVLVLFPKHPTKDECSPAACWRKYIYFMEKDILGDDNRYLGTSQLTKQDIAKDAGRPAADTPWVSECDNAGRYGLEAAPAWFRGGVAGQQGWALKPPKAGTGLPALVVKLVADEEAGVMSDGTADFAPSRGEATTCESVSSVSHRDTEPGEPRSNRFGATVSPHAQAVQTCLLDGKEVDLQVCFESGLAAPELCCKLAMSSGSLDVTVDCCLSSECTDVAGRACTAL